MDKGLLKQIYVKACASFFLPRPHEETILRERMPANGAGLGNVW